MVVENNGYGNPSPPPPPPPPGCGGNEGGDRQKGKDKLVERGVGTSTGGSSASG
jgi:hypothetical protein